MSGYLDGCDDIIFKPGAASHAPGCEGKISYLGGHQYSTNVPVPSRLAEPGHAPVPERAVRGAVHDRRGPVGDTDTDGDGVADDDDPFPDDPNAVRRLRRRWLRRLLDRNV